MLMFPLIFLLWFPLNVHPSDTLYFFSLPSLEIETAASLARTIYAKLGDF